MENYKLFTDGSIKEEIILNSINEKKDPKIIRNQINKINEDIKKLEKDIKKLKQTQTEKDLLPFEKEDIKNKILEDNEQITSRKATMAHLNDLLKDIKEGRNQAINKIDVYYLQSFGLKTNNNDIKIAEYSNLEKTFKITLNGEVYEISSYIKILKNYYEDFINVVILDGKVYEIFFDKEGNISSITKSKKVYLNNTDLFSSSNLATNKIKDLSYKKIEKSNNTKNISNKIQSNNDIQLKIDNLFKSLYNKKNLSDDDKAIKSLGVKNLHEALLLLSKNNNSISIENKSGLGVILIDSFDIGYNIFKKLKGEIDINKIEKILDNEVEMGTIPIRIKNEFIGGAISYIAEHKGINGLLNLGKESDKYTQRIVNEIISRFPLDNIDREKGLGFITENIDTIDINKAVRYCFGDFFEKGNAKKALKTYKIFHERLWGYYNNTTKNYVRQIYKKWKVNFDL